MIKLTMQLAQRGFSLIELAIVFFIVTLLMGGLLPTISAQIDQQRTTETRKQLDDIQQALIGYAIINGRLPCPASTNTNGIENPIGGGTCVNPYDGFVPAATLGISTGVDSQGNAGFAVDSWNNRIRYAVTQSNSKAFTTPNYMSTYFSTLAPDLQVCSTATGITGAGTASASCQASKSLTTGVPAVIYSTGKNGGYGGTGTDEKENPNPNSTATSDRLFISQSPTPSTAANGEFDDIVIWISPNILINRMISAGKLP